MNHPYGRKVITADKKAKRSPSVLALAVAFALAFPGSAALAQNTAGEPLPSIPVGLEGDPGSIKVSTKTDANGAFNFDKLPAGKYKVFIDGKPSQSVTVGAKRSVTGKLTRNNDGRASITVSDINGDGVPEARTFTVTVNPVNDPPSIADQAASGGLSSYRTATPPKDGTGKPPGNWDPLGIGAVAPSFVPLKGNTGKGAGNIDPLRNSTSSTNAGSAVTQGGPGKSGGVAGPGGAAMGPGAGAGAGAGGPRP